MRFRIIQRWPEFVTQVCTVFLFSIIVLATGCKDKSKPKELFKEGVPGSAAYSKDAVLFSLSMFSNVNEGMSTTIDSLQTHLNSSLNSILSNDTVQGLVGNWNIVWGPVNYTNDQSNPAACISDNVVVVLKGVNPSSPGDSMYVIAVAATNPDSPYDWAYEDFQADSMVQWPGTSSLPGNPNIAQFTNPATTNDPTVTKGGNYISQGTATGINVLWNLMTDPVSRQTLMQFLQSTVGKSTGSVEVATTGHSLAGALAPVLALSLKDNQSYWNPGNNCIITSYGTAGASPGNDNFAAYFTKNIGSNFVGAYNTLDIVPHAFEWDRMMQLPTIYDSLLGNVLDSASNCMIATIVTCVADTLKAFNYTSIYAPSTFFSTPISINVDSIYSAAVASWPGLSFKEKAAISAEIDQQCDLHFYSNHAIYYAVAICYSSIAAIQHSQGYINKYGAQQVAAIFSEYSVPGTFSLITFINDIASNPLIDCFL